MLILVNYFSEESKNLALKALKMSLSDVEQMKSRMTGWREILVMIHSVVTWEQVYVVICGLRWCGSVVLW